MVVSFLMILLVAHVHFVYGGTYSGFQEKYGQTLPTSENNMCYGNQACRGSTIVSGGNYVAYCLGQLGCYEATQISVGGDIRCGNSGCKVAGSMSGYNVDCRGIASCYGVTGTISAANDAQCQGTISCAYSTIQAGNDVYCYGQKSCSSATITAVDFVYIHGDQAAINAPFISAEKVYVYGYQGTAGATMDSHDESSMEVYQYGYQSGSGSKFYCRKVSTCTVYCTGQSCKGMTVYCETGATCNVECYDIGTDGCPTVENVVSLPSVDDIKKINDGKKIDYFDPEERGIKNEPTGFHYGILVILIVAVALTMIHGITAMKIMKSTPTQKTIN